MSESTFPKPRPLTRAEAKALKAAGLDPQSTRPILLKAKKIVDLPDDDEEKALEMLEEIDAINDLNEKIRDWILDNVYTNYNFDNAPLPDCRKLADETYRLTFGVTPAEEKNS